MKFSFIISLYNNLTFTEAMLKSFFHSTLLNKECYEIILINDFSSDGTSYWLKGLKNNNIKFIENESNLGYAKSNNKGAKKANGQYFIFINNDVLFKPSWFDQLLYVYESKFLNAGMVGNIQKKIDSDVIDHCGFELSVKGKFEHLKSVQESCQNYNKVLCVTGACFIVSRDDFFSVGGFDEGFLNGGEDIDLCFKIAALGKSIYVSHESQIQHYVALSRDLKSPQNEKNSQYLFQKWRIEIKNELSKIWQPLLSCESLYRQHIDGNLNSALLTTPSAAARIISENILSREDHRWSREIDRRDLNSNISKQLAVRGARYNKAILGYLVDDEIEITLRNTTSIQNFYVCGRRLDENIKELLEIRISVNGIQEKNFTMGAERHVNVGIINPLLFDGMDNIFTISIRSKVENGLLVGAGKSILVTHFVIDEKTIDQF